MNDPLIEQLSQGLRPVRPLTDRPVWTGAALGLCLATLYVSGFLHFRPEMAGLLSGSAASNPMVMAKPLMFLVIGLSALWGVLRLARPEGGMKWRYVLPAVVLGLMMVAGLMLDVVRHGVSILPQQLNGGALTCFSTIVCGGTVGLIVLWRFWLRRSASSQPATLGAMAGLMTGALMASAYALHCNMDAPVYILAVYGVSVALMSGFGALLGARLLRW